MEPKVALQKIDGAKEKGRGEEEGLKTIGLSKKVGLEILFERSQSGGLADVER